MRFGSIMMAVIAALSLAGTPVLAQVSASASKLSLSPSLKGARASKSMRDANQLGGSGIIIAVLAAAAVIAGIVIASDGNDDPSST